MRVAHLRDVLLGHLRLGVCVPVLRRAAVVLRLRREVLQELLQQERARLVAVPHEVRVRLLYFVVVLARRRQVRLHVHQPLRLLVLPLVLLNLRHLLFVLFANVPQLYPQFIPLLRDHVALLHAPQLSAQTVNLRLQLLRRRHHRTPLIPAPLVELVVVLVVVLVRHAANLCI